MLAEIEAGSPLFNTPAADRVFREVMCFRPCHFTGPSRKTFGWDFAGSFFGIRVSQYGSVVDDRKQTCPHAVHAPRRHVEVWNCGPSAHRAAWLVGIEGHGLVEKTQRTPRRACFGTDPASYQAFLSYVSFVSSSSPVQGEQCM